MNLGSIREALDLFYSLEEENQQLFAALKNTLMGAIPGAVGIIAMLHTVGWEHTDFILNMGFLLFGVFVALVCYRIWELVRFEFTWPTGLK
ncbi:hypothetical protein [Natrinema halophilum]|uniref:hypothetical protein n=1 Tax=Natrinema halophilum TaxID=1699371 RepID=UPI001F346D20|nr:hypothetical protein [Natrinema halophilum]UHQ96436.1 hypothetical protein HYG82_23640 [Natrinema halophilum]